jgi:predicted ATPase
VGELVESVARRPLDGGLWELATKIHGSTAGNPLFIDALLANLLDDPAQRSSAVERTVADTVGRRVARQPAEVVELLRAAAVAGLDFDLRVVARATGRDELVALEGLEAGALAGLVHEEAPKRYRFRHALIRSVLREQLSRSRLVRVHLQIGERWRQSTMTTSRSMPASSPITSAKQTGGCGTEGLSLQPSGRRHPPAVPPGGRRGVRASPRGPR